MIFGIRTPKSVDMVILKKIYGVRLSAKINVNVNVNIMQLYARRISMANVNMNVMQVYTQRISMANVNMNIMQLYTRLTIGTGESVQECSCYNAIHKAENKTRQLVKVVQSVA